jgi:hypothetical protein
MRMLALVAAPVRRFAARPRPAHLTRAARELSDTLDVEFDYTGLMLWRRRVIALGNDELVGAWLLLLLLLPPRVLGGRRPGFS